MFDLKRFRQDNNLNQTTFAELVGVKQASVSKAERGGMDVPVGWIAILRDEGYVVSEYYISNKILPQKGKISNNYNSDNEESSVVSKSVYDQNSSDQRNLVDTLTSEQKALYYKERLADKDKELQREKEELRLKRKENDELKKIIDSFVKKGLTL